MIKRNAGCLLLILTLGVSAAFAQKYSALKNNSAERTAILKALSAPVSKELKRTITFSKLTFKVKDNWAFVSGLPKNGKGGAVNWKITKYQELIDADGFEDGIYALLKKTAGKWRVVTYAMDCHDPCYLGWDKEYKAPKAIIGQ